jgi:sugar phosphate isomerase/epimerase
MPQSPAECRPSFAAQLKLVGGPEFTISSIHFPLILHAFLFNPYPSAREFGRQLCRDLAGLAGALGSTVIVIHSPSAKMSGPQFLAVARENMAYLCDQCADQGTLVALEHTESGAARTVPQMLEWADAIRHPNLGFTLDITHAHKIGADPVDFITGLPNLAHIHASDYGPVSGQHLPPGTGEVDWSRVSQALDRSAFEGQVILELSTHTIGADPVHTLRQSVAFLASTLGIAVPETGSGA